MQFYTVIAEVNKCYQKMYVPKWYELNGTSRSLYTFAAFCVQKIRTASLFSETAPLFYYGYLTSNNFVLILISSNDFLSVPSTYLTEA